MCDILIVNGIDYINDVKLMIQEYYRFLGRDLSFQNIDSELANPAEKYSLPNGELLVAIQDDYVLGMVAYHNLTSVCCEMKRLYVRPEGRGKKIGEALVKEIINHARQAGYKEMVLDTIEPLTAAIGLYHKMGFEECEPYYFNPMDDVIYFKKVLK